MWGTYASLALIAVLSMMLIAAAVSDLKSRTIPNLLNLAIALLAPLFWLAQGLEPWPDMAWQVAGAAAVFLPFFLLFAINAMGGGDVKMIAALALWLFPRDLLGMLFVMAVVGGGIAAAMLIHHRLNAPDPDPATPDVLPPDNRPAPEVPYGVAIAVAGLWALHQHYLNHLPLTTAN